jgi:protein-disulfide isomerase
MLTGGMKKQIADNKVVIFSKSYCPYCKRVKGLFASEFSEEKPVVFECVSFLLLPPI